MNSTMSSIEQIITDYSIVVYVYYYIHILNFFLLTKRKISLYKYNRVYNIPTYKYE